jgi:hypothetical protein
VKSIGEGETGIEEEERRRGGGGEEEIGIGKDKVDRRRDRRETDRGGTDEIQKRKNIPLLSHLLLFLLFSYIAFCYSYFCFLLNKLERVMRE